ncbi:MAG: 2-phosphosulfolactate phosphatase [Lyngbya sp. HA4199-MV5]|jgi:2-phosphosulfolactate phosphatase|nr:2-phosphosulfolactate phosphatase [Lyngbya sp. HA4199-MV5]
MSFYDQSAFNLRCEWGTKGVVQLAPISDVVIIVDVLSFSTCVEIATSRGAIVFPCIWQQQAAQEFAISVEAELALRRGDQSNGSLGNWSNGSLGDTPTGTLRNRGASNQYSLSPQSLCQIPCGTRLVLPSPNGSTLSLATGETPTLAGCLRNCQAVAAAATNYGSRIAVIPAGEKWDDGSLRPSYEDWIGAGAILSYLTGHVSPEAESAIAAFRHAAPTLNHHLKQCGSGKELMGKGFESDVDLAAEFNVSEGVPILHDRAYR